MWSGNLLRSFLFLFPLLLLLTVQDRIPIAMGEDAILIDDAFATVSDRGIEHSATFTNLLDALITFDALIRLDMQNDILRLDARTITLGPGNSITIEGVFAVTELGSYVVRWEALSPPPGEPLATGRQFTIVIMEEEPEPPPEKPEELPDPGEEGPLPEEPVEQVDPQEPLDPIEEEPAQDNLQKEEEEKSPADPIVEEPDPVIEEPAADPSPPDPEVGVPAADPVLPPAQVEEPARDEDAPVGDAPVIVPRVEEELPVLSPPAPPAPAPPPQLAGNAEDQATNSAFNNLVIVAIGVVVWASIMGIILRRRSQNWKYDPLFADE